jgi:hypothetical protein
MAVNDPVAGRLARCSWGGHLRLGSVSTNRPRPDQGVCLLIPPIRWSFGVGGYYCGAQPCSSVDYGNTCNTIRIGWRKIILMGKSPGHEIVEEASWLTELAGATS